MRSMVEGLARLPFFPLPFRGEGKGEGPMCETTADRESEIHATAAAVFQAFEMALRPSPLPTLSPEGEREFCGQIVAADEIG